MTTTIQQLSKRHEEAAMAKRKHQQASAKRLQQRERAKRNKQEEALRPPPRFAVGAAGRVKSGTKDPEYADIPLGG
jgi:hypothetical protein